eukprot:EG_transcript_27262
MESIRGIRDSVGWQATGRSKPPVWPPVWAVWALGSSAAGVGLRHSDHVSVQHDAEPERGVCIAEGGEGCAAGPPHRVAGEVQGQAGQLRGTPQGHQAGRPLIPHPT